MRGSLREDLDRWVDQGLLSVEQSDAILTAETRIPPRPETGIPVFAEALGYAGAAFAAAGGAVALGRRWESFGDAGRLAIVAGATVLVILCGFAARRARDPAFGRLASVLFALAVRGRAGSAAHIGADLMALEGDVVAVIVGAAMVPVAAGLWRSHRRTLTQIALGVSAIVLATATLGWVVEEPASWAFSAVVWSIGAAWAVTGLLGIVEPRQTALVAGAAVAAMAGFTSPPDTWFLGVALLTSIALMAGSVPTGELALLGIGSVSLFVLVTEAVLEHFGDSLGVPLTLTVIGLVFIGVAVGSTRIARLRRRL